jgi:putative FmdB family regulatory protein
MTYPFKCKTCGTEFDIHMSVKKYELLRVFCPICKSNEAQRIFYSKGVSVIYKDDGFTKFVSEK